MYVNKAPLLVTLSRNVKFGTVEATKDQKEATLLKSIATVVTLYRKAGFTVTTALIDGEFVPLRRGLAEIGITLNETSRDEHVGDIERYIRTVKERMRAICNTMPFRKVPARLVIEMAKTAVFWLNAFPVLMTTMTIQMTMTTMMTTMTIPMTRMTRMKNHTIPTITMVMTTTMMTTNHIAPTTIVTMMTTMIMMVMRGALTPMMTMAVMEMGMILPQYIHLKMMGWRTMDPSLRTL